MKINFLSVVAVLGTAFSVFSPQFGTAAGSAPQPSICTRPCWGARAPGSISYMSTLNRATIHHTANSGEFNTSGLEASKANMRNNQNYHMDVNGWSDIGYHFLVDKFGNTFEGRHNSMSGLPRGAHDGINTNSFGFTFMCYAHPPHNQTPPTVMRQALYNVIAWRMPNGWNPIGTSIYNGVTEGKLTGHRDVKATACPGDSYYGPYLTSNTSGGEARTEVNNKINGGGGGLPTYTLDNNQAGFSVVGSWATGTSAGDKYGADYRYKSTDPSSQPATWAINVGVAGTYRVQAWWAAGSNRSATAPYILPGGGSSPQNQQGAGGQWNTLGSRALGVGTNSTMLSIWTTPGFLVIADAIRYTP